MQFNRAKLNALILYICSKCELNDLGAVKLHKVLYFSDMIHYAEFGNAITGSTYRKRPFGPTCDQLLPALRELVAKGDLKINDVEFFGFKKKEYAALTQPDASEFDTSKLAIIDEVIEFVCKSNSARSISELSHTRAWELARFGEVLPYNSVFQIFPVQVSMEAMEWGATQVADIAAEKSRSNPLDYVSIADFRGRVLSAGNA